MTILLTIRSERNGLNDFHREKPKLNGIQFRVLSLLHLYYEADLTSRVAMLTQLRTVIEYKTEVIKMYVNIFSIFFFNNHNDYDYMLA